MQLTLHPFELSFRHPFTISRKSKSVQPLLIVALTKGGLTGLGETIDNAYYQMTVLKLTEAIEQQRVFIENYDFTTPAQFWADLYPLFQDNLFALCGLDIAAHDLYAQLQEKKLYEVLGGDILRNPLSDYTIGIDTIENMLRKMEEIPSPIYKIKLGTKEDIKIVQALRTQSSAVFRVDANCAWGVEETLSNALAFSRLNVEFIEQPLKAEDREGMKRVYEACVLPCIADESCITEADVALCEGYFHGVNIKLTKCGGITPALRMVQTARTLGLKLMIGSMSESTVGTSAAAHLLPMMDYADLDSPLLLNDTISRGIRIEYGKIHYADRAGTGAVLI
jgi:L-alanine-DL-glutamate epimerase-like enolase superfamily enzyme